MFGANKLLVYVPLSLTLIYNLPFLVCCDLCVNRTNMDLCVWYCVLLYLQIWLTLEIMSLSELELIKKLAAWCLSNWNKDMSFVHTRFILLGPCHVVFIIRHVDKWTVVQYRELLRVTLAAININNLHAFLCDFNLISGVSRLTVMVDW